MGEHSTGYERGLALALLHKVATVSLGRRGGGRHGRKSPPVGPRNGAADQWPLAFLLR